MADSETAPTPVEAPEAVPTQQTEATAEPKPDEAPKEGGDNESKPEDGSKAEGATESGTQEETTLGEEEESEDSYEYDPEEAEVKMDFNTFEEQLEILREREQYLTEQLEFKTTKYDLLKEDYKVAKEDRTIALSILHRVQMDIDQLHGELKMIQGERPWVGMPEDATDRNSILLWQVGDMRNCLARFETQKIKSRKELDEIKDTLRHYLFELRKIFLGIQEKLMEVIGAEPPRYHPTYMMQNAIKINHDILFNQIKEIMPLIEEIREKNARQVKLIDVLKDDLEKKNLEIEEYVKISNQIQ